jgi:hypothetical protein
MPTDLHGGVRLLIATLMAVVAVAFAGAAAAKTPSPRARAAQVLRGLGYTNIHVSCSRKGTCHWRGVRAGRTCSGAITTSKRRRILLRFTRVKCSGGATDPPPPPLQLGFNTYTDQLTVSKQRQEGATLTRLFVNWYQVEPRAGAWSWNNTDQEYQEIVKGGLRPLIVVNGAPCWASTSCQTLFQAPPSTKHDSDWSAYVRAVTARYPQAAGIEVWNEPNLAAAFYPQADPVRYTQLLSEAYTAVKSVNSSMPVISGGLAMNDTDGAGGSGYASRTFLAGMYAAGARRYMDAVGIHAYPTDTASDGSMVWDPAALARWLQQVDDVAASNGVQAPPVWITEMGVSTSTEHGFPPAATPDQQASYLSSMINMAQTDPEVRAAIIDSLQDAPQDVLGDLLNGVTGPLINYDVSYTQLEEGLGVFTSSWVPKPAACAVGKEFGGTITCDS